MLFDGAFVKHSRFKVGGGEREGREKREKLAIEFKSVILKTI